MRPTPLLLLAGTLAAAPAAAQPAAAPAAASTATHGIAVSHMDRAVVPGNDFYAYANGTWVRSLELPPDRASLSALGALGDTASQRTAALIAGMARTKAAPGTNARKVADLYASYMDSAAVEARGMAPLAPHLAAVRAIADRRQLARALGAALRADVDALNNTNFHTPNLFGLWVAPGFHDPDHYVPYLLQGGLELPDREYYLSETPRMVELRAHYLSHVSAMLGLAGLDSAEVRARRILELEHAIAATHRSLAGNEDIRKADNTWARADFATRAPGMDWAEFFRGAGLQGQGRFTVWQPEAFAGESRLVASVPLDAWKDWLAFHLVEDYAGALPRKVVDERFAFYGVQLQGTTQPRPRWQRGVAVVNALLGDAVGQAYARRYFSPAAKAQVQDMVAKLIASFRARVRGLTWMAPATKAEAEAKLNTLYVGVGYPETWRDYSAYDVRADDLFGNVWRGALLDYHHAVSRLGKPVNRHEWSMTPQTVNAVNLPLQNALNFPAAILQPPFFDPQAPAAVNFGAIGTIIGHEISHTFDTEGSAFDARGRVRDWWTPADYAHFHESTARLAAQYSAYHAFPDLALNGEQTLAENIADVAGISAAYDGFHASLHGAAAPTQDGLTGDQQFFIAFAQNWAAKARENALRQQVLTDPHSPGAFRVLTVRNIDGWYPAFDVKPGETLYLAPDQRVRIW